MVKYNVPRKTGGREMGKLIVIEGASDGIGKSTQLELLMEKLKKENIEVMSHHFPTYGTPQGRPVEMYLKGEFGPTDSLSPYFINTTFALDRAATYKKEFSEFYNNGGVIICDRYTTSSLIYQCASLEGKEKEDFIDYVIDFEYNKLGVKEPDAVIFLDADYDAIEAIRRKRTIDDNIEEDILESDRALLRKVYDNSHFVCERLGWTKVICDDGKGGMRDKNDIGDEVYAFVSSLL